MCDKKKEKHTKLIHTHSMRLTTVDSRLTHNPKNKLLGAKHFRNAFRLFLVRFAYGKAANSNIAIFQIHYGISKQDFADYTLYWSENSPTN